MANSFDDEARMERVPVHEAVSQEARRLRAAQFHTKEQVEELESQVKQLRMVLKSKDEAVAKLQHEKAEYEELVGLQNEQISQLENQVDKRVDGIGNVEKQLKKSEEEFEMLGEALEEKNREVEKKNGEIAGLEEKVRKMEDEVDRQKVIIRRTAQAPKVEKEDVCLSARSFSENHLISLRDDALEVKEKQIALINENNDHLGESIVHLEKEMEHMQADMVRKDKIISVLTKEKQGYLSRISELERAVEVKEGREAAMEVATKQNTQLLQLLQQQETMTQEMELKIKKQEREIDLCQSRLKKALHRGAEFEVEATTEKANVRSLTKELGSVKGTWAVEEKSLRERLSRLEETSTKTINELQEELRVRREKHYEMLQQVQVSEKKFQEAEDHADYCKAELSALSSKNKELDARLIETKLWAEKIKQKTAQDVSELQKQLDNHQSQIESLQIERNALSAQLHEMSGTLLKAVDKQRIAIDESTEMRGEVGKKNNELNDMKRRMAKEGTLQGKRRMKVELEQQSLLNQLTLLQRENKKLAKATNASFEEQTREVSELSTRCRNLEERLEEARNTEKCRLFKLIRYIQASCTIIEGDTCVVPLDNCHLGASRCDEERGSVITTLTKHLVQILNNQERRLTIRLMDNNLQDTDVQGGLDKLVRARFKAECVRLDLSGNSLSTVAVRNLVLALQKNPDVQHVYAHRDGTIHGLRGADIVYTIDLKNNIDTLIADNQTLPMLK
uniref:Uncharacterized protein n=1 Tax=Mucochytrium quahogii TaxID=96639 RepID=A0A7S2RDK2_9STRA|mmetsp:Transcript_23343/g.37218  ORF Transcript_23343/g.37218 Transcript_23343/m.37218 type:complete len:736 (-) Transcript_23343:185-2392(-)